MIQLVRKQAMPATVAREKINLPAMHLPANDRIRRTAERRLDPLFGRTLDTLHLVKAASADDPDRWGIFSHSARLNCNLPESASLSNGVALARPAPLCQTPLA